MIGSEIAREGEWALGHAAQQAIVRLSLSSYIADVNLSSCTMLLGWLAGVAKSVLE